MTYTIIHLLRHGEVENPDNVIYERLPDFCLSERGAKMAEQVAKYVRKHPVLKDIKNIYSSPLERTAQTVKPVAKMLKIKPIYDDRLLESKHKLSGINPKKQIINWLLHLKFLKIINLIYNPFRPSWGEPFIEISRRMQSIIEDVRKNHQGEQTLLVSHQCPIWIARLTYENKRLSHNPNSRICQLASVTTLYFNDDIGELEKVVYRIPARNV